MHSLTDTLSDHFPKDARALAEALYGVSWRSSVQDLGSSSWRAKRLPPPLQVAPLLAPALAGLAAHDGRSTYQGRGLGWWILDRTSGSWHEADTDSLGLEILPALQGITLQAQQDASSASRSLQGVERRSRLHDERSSALSDARLRAALLEALSALVASGSSGRWGNVVQALRTRLALPEAAVRSIVLDSLQEAADLEGWSEGDRLSPASLWEAVDESGAAMLPRRTFLRALPALLGDLRKVQGVRLYVLPDLDAVEVSG